MRNRFAGCDCKRIPTAVVLATDQKLRFLTETWLYELGQRRLVWCWNRWTYEQHAMWRFYGQRGVAIHSTVGVIRRAFSTSWSGWQCFAG